jgi:NAD(P)-dependent dehydrogenase (short-subunit alcohol dehydrogenase family)
VSAKTNWALSDAPRQDGKRVLVTGGASGIGYQAARAMAALGAEVTIAVRDPSKGQEALTRLRAEVPEGTFAFERVDLANLRSIADFGQRFLARNQPLDILMNVAGVMAIPTRTTTADGFEAHMGTNHLGHFALTGQLLPALRAAQGRVVVVSALVAKFAKLDLSNLQSERGYSPMRAYGLSKLAEVLFSVELNRRGGPSGVTSVPVDPGTANTELQRHGGSAVQALGRRLINVIGYPLDRVADNLLFAATAAEPGNETYVGPSQFIQRCAHPSYVSLPKQARDPSVCDALWRASEELTRIGFEFS